MTDRSTGIIEQFVDSFNRGDAEGWSSFLRDDFVDHTPGPQQASGRRGFVEEKLVELRRSFPDLQLTSDDVISEGTTIAWRWTLEGTNLGAFAGRAPTGHKVRFQGMNFERLDSDGRIAEHWSIHDSMDLLGQLGFFD